MIVRDEESDTLLIYGFGPTRAVQTGVVTDRVFRDGSPTPGPSMTQGQRRRHQGFYLSHTKSPRRCTLHFDEIFFPRVPLLCLPRTSCRLGLNCGLLNCVGEIYVGIFSGLYLIPSERPFGDLCDGETRLWETEMGEVATREDALGNENGGGGTALGNRTTSPPRRSPCEGAQGSALGSKGERSHKSEDVRRSAI